VAGFVGNLLGAGNILLKGCWGVVVMMWARWTLPRLRIDQVMTVCLKYCIPLAAVMLVGATLWAFAFPGGLVFRQPSANEQTPTGVTGSLPARPRPALAHEPPVAPAAPLGANLASGGR
jgi:hypothetical protein